MSRADSWWREGVIYQIYPRSFQDSNGDGVGDLGGIIRRLPYVAELGADAVWLSPIFPSPMADFGYDICDYTDIHPAFGTLADFDSLLATAHQLGLKVILDLVPNHTSDQHPWFRESREARENPKREWYLWRDPAPGGGVPNNWLSEFGGSAWEYDRRTGQYYYHAFLPAQPDLNWRSSEVRAAIYDAMRFWLRRGVDGFRVDVIWHLIKDDQFRDNPPNPDYHGSDPPSRALLPFYTADQPEVHEVIAQMRSVTEEFGARVLIGEIYLPIERLVAYYGRDLSGLHLPLNFSLLLAPWQARTIAGLIEQYETSLPPGGWPNWVLGNHDQPRVATRVGADQARIAAMLLLTLRGTPTVYYGDEIGMSEAAIAPDKIRDPVAARISGRGRDGCRTPMQWDGTSNAGFSPVEPWLPVSPNFSELNVERQRSDQDSIFNLFRRLIRLRRRTPALASGSYHPLVASGDLLLYVRQKQPDRILVALNLSGDPTAVELSSGTLAGTVAVSSAGDRDGEEVHGRLDLRGNEGAVIALAPETILP
ncbi:MAG TPA: alpha-amylase family glycosyl hydrolase [Xanthobacteraceae bacterium]|jgi:alpha-glucosidase